MIRFGFRPYFLEKTSREPCPTECRCYIKHDMAREFCKLSKPGCDMRSSDFYVIHKTSYAPLLSKLLDLKQANSKRIIDTAPMRSLANQWLILPQASIQTKLDIPIDYQAVDPRRAFTWKSASCLVPCPRSRRNNSYTPLCTSTL